MTPPILPDGGTLASASYDGTIRLWNARSGAYQQTLEGHNGPVTSVAFSPDGGTLASGSFEGTILLWDIRRYHALGRHQNVPPSWMGRDNRWNFHLQPPL